jgi:hypothetical protein
MCANFVRSSNLSASRWPDDARPVYDDGRICQGREEGESNMDLSRRIVVLLLGGLAATAAAGEEGETATAADRTAAAAALSKPAGAATAKVPSAESRSAAAPASSRPTPAPPEQVAVANQSPVARRALKPTAALTSPATSQERLIAQALQTIADCQVRYRRVDDYTCTLYKQERIGGRMTQVHIMEVKARARPHSIYLKFHQPAHGREAIYVSGHNDGKVLAHDVGLTKLLAGTLQLDPLGSRAMEDCRHPITEAGIGPLLDTVSKHWARELTTAESKILFRDDMLVGNRRCTMIESTHPEHRTEFLFYRVRLFIDQEIGLPIRFEAYDWPKHTSEEPELQEEYTYMNLKLNVGLKDLDFETSNAAYSFGRF